MQQQQKQQQQQQGLLRKTHQSLVQVMKSQLAVKKPKSKWKLGP